MSSQLRFVVDSRESFAEGFEFGSVGAYEWLRGRVVFTIDPFARDYEQIVDLTRTSRDSSGHVVYETSFSLCKPVDIRAGNRRLFYDVVNRGDKRALQFFNEAPHSNVPERLDHAGNGYLMRRGYALLWCGWQGDVLPGDGRETIGVPEAVDENTDIVGLVREEIIVEESSIESVQLSGNAYTRSYPAASLQTSGARLTCREYENDERQPIAASRWQFATLDDKGRVLPSATHLYLPGGFKPGWIYELVYQAAKPLVLGLGFAAVRDLVSFLRYDTADCANVANPLWDPQAQIEKAYAWGRSQSGRFLREFVYRGWNEDRRGRRVFDAVWPHVTGAGRLALNLRFGHPDRYPRQHEEHLYPSDQFPFAYVQTTDPWSGRSDAILKRPDSDPLILHTQTCSEYWQRRGSLVHTDAFGVDLPDHPLVRLFAFASSQHHAAPGVPAQAGNHQNLTNPLNTSSLLRALLEGLDAWATYGTPLPPSAVPRRADGTLVSAQVVREKFPSIDGIELPGEPNRLLEQDYGPQYADGIVTQEPPVVGAERAYAVLVPAVDADGNDVAGLRTPDIAVPLATYTGWNLRAKGHGNKALYSVAGSYIPFAVTRPQQSVGSDPRLSLRERYPSHSAYVRRVAVAAQLLVDRRLLLAEDADAYVAAAIARGVPDCEEVAS